MSRDADALLTTGPSPDWKDKMDEEDEVEPVNIWEDNWDDDNIEDDFSKQLK